MSYASVIAGDAPLAWYRLGDASGTTATDSSGNSHNGTYTNSPTLGAAGLLTGDSDTAMGVTSNSGTCVSVTSGTWMDVSSITVEAWTSLTSAVDATNGDAIASRYATGGFNWLLWRNTTGKWAVQIRNTAGTAYNIATASSVSTSTTYHLAFTFDGFYLRLYVDGAEAAAAVPVTGTVQTSTNNIEIGRYSGSNATTPSGTVDEVAIYNTALSATQIATHHSVGIGVTPILTGTWGLVS